MIHDDTIQKIFEESNKRREITNYVTEALTHAAKKLGVYVLWSIEAEPMKDSRLINPLLEKEISAYYLYIKMRSEENRENWTDKYYLLNNLESEKEIIQALAYHLVETIQKQKPTHKG